MEDFSANDDLLLLPFEEDATNEEEDDDQRMDMVSVEWGGLQCPLTQKIIEQPVQGVHCTHYAPFNRRAYTKLAMANFKKINQTTEDILDDLKSLFNALCKAYEVPPNSLLEATLLRTLWRRLRSINHIHSQWCPLCKAPAPADDSLIHTTDFKRMTSVIMD